ncbi:MAG: hypothetical protein ACOY3X_08275 [Pseudomonadota bacterium]
MSTVARTLTVFLLIVLAETLHGVLRQLYLVPAIGDLPSRQLGVFTGSLLILVIATLTARWLALPDRRAQLQAGLLCVVLMIAFEAGLGFTLGYGSDRLLADYDPARGGFMGFGMLVLLLAPMTGAAIRGKTRSAP